MARRKSCCLKSFFNLIIFLVIAAAIIFFAFYDGIKIVSSMFFPTEYEEYVEKYSSETGLDPYLVYSVIKVESSFNKDAESEAGAKGLMQLMEETAYYSNGIYKLGYNIPDEIFEPEANIRIGCYYLKQLIDKYEVLDTALAAYNGGIGNVDKWLSNPEITDHLGKLKNIPFNETELYVKKVTTTYKIYKKIYEEGNNE